MSSAQLPDIEATVLSAIREAYDLGRSDALKKVVAAVHGDVLPPEPPRALMAPSSAVPPAASPPLVNGAGGNGAEQSQPTPWWAFPVR